MNPACGRCSTSTPCCSPIGKAEDDLYPWHCGWTWSGTTTARWGAELGGSRFSREANAAVEASMSTMTARLFPVMDPTSRRGR